MTGTHFCRNGQLEPVSQAVFPMDDIAVVYGCGAYETLKLRRGILYFPERHARRLHRSCEILGIACGYSEHEIVEWLNELVRRNGIADCNLKLMLHGRTDARADITILALNPFYPKREEVRKGTRVVSYSGVRQFPEAKSFSMLLSSLAFAEARSRNAYDAVFVSPEDEILEGTRTNLFYFRGGRYFTPPADRVLPGITRETIMEAAGGEGIEITERSLYLRELRDFGESDALMVTSTSSKIIPVRFFNDQELSVPPESRRLRDIYDRWLRHYADSRETLVNCLSPG